MMVLVLRLPLFVRYRKNLQNFIHAFNRDFCPVGNN